MLSAILLDGFRAFGAPTRVTFGALTLLAGANSAGKSSVIHALLSLVQSERQPRPGHLRLSGEWVDIGSFAQALNYSRQGEQRKFMIGVSGTISDIDTDLVIAVGEPEESLADAALIERIEACVGDTEVALDGGSEATGLYKMLFRDDPASPWKEFGGYTKDLYPWSFMPTMQRAGNEKLHRLIPYEPDSTLYLSAFRDPPRAHYPSRRSKLGPLLGAMGEHVAETLFERRNTTVDILPGGGPPRLLGAALEAWWSYIFGGDYSIRAEPAGKDVGYTLSLDTPSAEDLKLTQVGTGLSQALPVVVLGLCSRAGDLVIVESPEVQLHPAAQHRLMDLFVALARSGRQVILETHSDHIIHAAQIAVKDKRLPNEQVSMQFLSQDKGAAQVERVPVGEDGRMKKQPIGFVDQATADLLELMR